MQIPKNVLIIGQISGITYKADKARAATSIDFDARGGEYLLATDKAHRNLYIFENVKTGKVDAVIDKSGIVKGFIHQAVHYKVPTLKLKKIGSVLTIRYTSVWWENKRREYRHDFKKGVAMYADKYTRFSTIGIKPTRGKVLNADGITA